MRSLIVGVLLVIALRVDADVYADISTIRTTLRIHEQELAELYVHVEDVADRELFREVHNTNRMLMEQLDKLQTEVIKLEKPEARHNTIVKWFIGLCIIAVICMTLMAVLRVFI